MLNHLRILVFIILIPRSPLGASQPFPEPDFNILRLRQWTSEDGLPQNTVRSLCQSQEGYIWAATSAGLVRFDGVHIDVFNRRNVPLMKNDDILCVLEDSKGVLWFGTDGGGLGSVFRDDWHIYTREDGLSNDHVRSLAEDNRGNLWVGTDYGLNRLGVEGFSVYTTEDGLYGSIITALDCDVLGTIWIGTLMSGLSKYDDGAFTNYGIASGLNNISVMSVYADFIGRVYIGTLQGLFVLNVKEERIRPIPRTSYTPVTALTASEHGLWIGTMADGLFRRTRDAFDIFSSEDGLPDDYVHTVLVDRTGRVWAGTDAAGMIRMEDPLVKTIICDGLPEHVISTVLIDSGGDLWIGTRNSGLCRISGGKELRMTDKSSGLSGNRVRALYEDQQNRIWVGTEDGGVTRIDPDGYLDFNRRNGLFSDQVTSIVQDGSGNLWIGTDRGLNRIYDGRIDGYGPEEGLADMVVRTLYRAGDGTLYVGTKGGVYRHERDRFWILGSGSEYSEFEVNSLFQDGEGILWIGTNGNGLLRWNGERFRLFTEADGLLNASIYSIAEDSDGNLWMSSPQGVFRVEKQSLNTAAEDERRSLFCTYFNETDGMPSRQCFGTAQPGFAVDDDGKLYVATLKGVAVFDPSILNRSRSAPSVLIESILADGEALKFDEIVSIPPGTEQIEVRFTAIDFIQPEKMRFRYRLEGFDPEYQFVEPGAPRKAIYRRLRASTYTFAMNAANNTGVWSDDDLSIRIVVPASSFRRTVLRIIIFSVLLFVILACAAAEYRKRRKQSGKYRTSTLDPERAEEIVPRLRSLMEEDKIFLDPDLTLKDLAQRLRIHSNHLSRIINERFEMGYNDYVNRYRIEEAKRKLADPAEMKKGISEILIETGFYSKSVFNTAFKRFTGITPSQYRRKQSS